MTRFNFALNLRTPFTYKATNPVKGKSKRMTKVDIEKLRQHYIDMENADKDFLEDKRQKRPSKRFKK